MAPADKSISHRAAVIASISDKPVEIRYFLEADDTLATVKAMKACGVGIERLGDGHYRVDGVGIRGLVSPDGDIDVGNSGTTMRLLPGIFAGQAGRSFTLKGDASLRRRPMDRIVKPLRRMGVDIRARENRFAPLTVTGGPVKAIDYNLPVASAQVKSAVLLAGLYADGPTTVTEQAVCRDHTERMLEAAGAKVTKRGLTTVISPAQHLRLPDLAIPGDISSAAFFLVAATIIPDSHVVLTRVGTNHTRTGLIDIMKSMGANIEVRNEISPYGEPYADVHVKAAMLSGVNVGGDISGRAIDELPLVALLGAFAEGETVVTGATELRVKESDRITGLVENMKAIGADIEALPDGFKVRGTGGIEGGPLFKSFGDHRMAMLGAIAGLASRKGVTVSGFGCVSVSFPDFEMILRDLASEAMVVAIDGPAGAGKSTISRMLAARFGWTYLDTGAMYRTLTLLALEQNIAPADGEELGRLAANMEMSFQPGPDGVPRVFAGCREVTRDIRGPEVTGSVSEVSAHATVRDAMLQKQRQLMSGGAVVVDGRDIGTVVWPQAEVKIFLTASPSERARRRRLELTAAGIEVSRAEMERQIAARDDYDSHREVAPLKPAADAVTLDTTTMSIDQVVDRVADIVDSRGR